MGYVLFHYRKRRRNAAGMVNCSDIDFNFLTMPKIPQKKIKAFAVLWKYPANKKGVLFSIDNGHEFQYPIFARYEDAVSYRDRGGSAFPDRIVTVEITILPPRKQTKK